ncbi:MAG: hypothetical protein KKA42_08415, partial [candidate division Zixibacteria bacterium]|nr:hypothetical protein [candidate division Zixibacteria bacterium]
MKSLWTLTLLTLAVFALMGCDDDEILVEDAVPATPQGVFSVTGDGVVHVYWNGIYERDVREYWVYRSDDDVSYYFLVSVEAEDNPNLDLYLYQYD